MLRTLATLSLCFAMTAAVEAAAFEASPLVYHIDRDRITPVELLA